MTSAALRFGGQSLGLLVQTLHPGAWVPDWCWSHTLPGPDLVVGTIDKLAGDPACSSEFFAAPAKYASRGLLPVNSMGPGSSLHFYKSWPLIECSLPPGFMESSFRLPGAPLPPRWCHVRPER